MRDMQVTCLSGAAQKHQFWRFAAAVAGLLTASLLAASCSSTATPTATSAGGSGPASAPSTIWLCKPGIPNDPCTQSLQTTVVSPTGAISASSPKPANSAGFACFYVYGTVSQETSVNANLAIQSTEVNSAIDQGSPFSPVCQVYAPIYRQVTLADLVAHPDLNFGPAETVTAYDSIRSGFEDFLTHELGDRPFVVIGDSQGAAMLNLLLQNIVDPNPALRARLVAGVILGGNVEVPRGQLVGGTFKHIPACSSPGHAGCVIAFSSFPSTPPADSLFGQARPGRLAAVQPDGQDRPAGGVRQPGRSVGRDGPTGRGFPHPGQARHPVGGFPRALHRHLRAG